MDVGAVLREARLQAGLSHEDISQRTKIQPAKIEALEANAFERLPEGIYLDGLVRAYAAEVGLDGSELVARLRENLLTTPAPDVTAFDEFPSEERLPEERHSDDRLRENAHHDASPYMVVPAEPIAHAIVGPHAVSDIDDTPLDVGDTPLDRDVLLLPAQGQRRRVSGLLIPALVLIASVGLGAWLYDRTRPFAEREPTDVPALTPRADSDATGAAPSDPSGADATRTTRDSRNDPADAIRADGGAGTSAHHTSGTPPAPSPEAPTPTPDAPTSNAPRARPPGEPSVPVASAPAPAASGAPGASASPASRVPVASAPEAARGVTSAPAPGAPGTTSAPGAPTAPGAPSAPRVPSAPSAPGDLSGFWTLDTRVESSSLSSFAGLQLGYRLELQQSGNRITGQGIKTLENGRTIGDSAQTPIIVSGTLVGKRLTLTFTERGTRRESGGKMILDVHEDGVLRGRFSSNAARSTGLAEARRPEG